MQTTLDRGYWRDARFTGVLRYQWKALSHAVLLVLGILLAAQTFSLLAPLVVRMKYPFDGVYADLSITMIAALVCSIVAAGKSTRFLLRFGTSRFSVWLGNLVSLFVGMSALLLGTLLLSMLTGALTLALANVQPTRYEIRTLLGAAGGWQFYGVTLLDALRSLPRYILYTLEWTCLFYFLGCCLRRNLGATLFVVIGVPMLLMILTLIPAVRQAMEAVNNADQGRMMQIGLQWMKYLADFVRFVQKEWQTLKLLAAVGSLPLSYLCMRNTPQP